MPGGTKQGGLKAAATNKDRYGDDFYKRIGAKGGKIGGGKGGFRNNSELAKRASKKGIIAQRKKRADA